jgi:hypothetical protein
MTAYMIDSSITPLHFMVSDELIVTDRARTHLAADGWTSPEALVALLLDFATDIRNIPEIQHAMYIEQFCANRRTKETL